MTPAPCSAPCKCATLNIKRQHDRSKYCRVLAESFTSCRNNLIELWVVATRPAGQNGLGLTPSIAHAEIARLRNMFDLLPDSAAIYPIWEELVVNFEVSGKPAHDARLVAAMRAHGLTAILTFDKTGFSRYPGIEVVDPADIAH